jgi:hypothetical protein
MSFASTGRSKSLCAPDNYNTESYKVNLTAWQPTATLTPSVIPNSNYVIMASDWKCLKIFVCLFYCNHQITETFWSPCIITQNYWGKNYILCSELERVAGCWRTGQQMGCSKEFHAIYRIRRPSLPLSPGQWWTQPHWKILFSENLVFRRFRKIANRAD